MAREPVSWRVVEDPDCAVCDGRQHADVAYADGSARRLCLQTDSGVLARQKLADARAGALLKGDREYHADSDDGR